MTTTSTTPPGTTHYPADARGATRLGWLDSRHSFSFGQYHDPQRLGYHGLRVLNDDRVAPGGGFGTHPHADMEILSWVLAGGMTHRDSMGSESTLRPGTAQLMSAGTGVTHSEFNASDTEPVHFLQVWIEPRQRGLTPNYQELAVEPAQRVNRFAVLASPDGRDGSMAIQADALVSVAEVSVNGQATAPIAPGRVAYAHIATGAGRINGLAVKAGDALAIEHATEIVATSDDAMQALLFDLPV